MSWEVVIKSQTEIHVIPDEDVHEHSIENGWSVKELYFSKCSCGARCEFANSNWITIHSSFDGREGVEWATAILSQK